VSAFLLDVNALIALLDPAHMHHDRAHAWFAVQGMENWVSSPTTENGTIRIASHPKYSNAQPAPIVHESLQSLKGVGHHHFVPDALSLLDDGVMRANVLGSSLGALREPGARRPSRRSATVALQAHDRRTVAGFFRRVAWPLERHESVDESLVAVHQRQEVIAESRELG
jgi:uncharacterized protein